MPARAPAWGWRWGGLVGGLERGEGGEGIGVGLRGGRGCRVIGGLWFVERMTWLLVGGFIAISAYWSACIGIH